MFEVFSDIFACRENVLTRVDARPKLVIAVSLIFAVVLSTRAFLPLLVLVACVGTLIALRMPAKLVLFRLAGPIGIVIVLVALQAFLTSGTAVFSIHFAGYGLTATEEGFRKGLLLGSRVLGAVSVVLVLSSVSPAHKIFHALRWFRVPEGWVEIALLVYRYTFALLDQTADVAEAQKVRLGYSSFGRSLSSVGVLAGTVITRSMDQAMRTYEAMTLRGYQGHLPFGPLPKITPQDLKYMIIMPAAIVAVFLIVEWWPK